MSIHFRAIIFLAIWIVYLLFMKFYSPLGIDWLDWHAKRVFYSSEFLKINGYFSYYGFTIFDKCNDCSLYDDEIVNSVYLTRNLFSFFPYLIINHFSGKEGLMYFGPIFDKAIIFACAFLLAELSAQLFKTRISNKKKYLISLLVFIFFIVNPWTYKMIIAPWFIIFFIFFLLLAIYFLINKKINYYLASLLLASIIDYQSASILLFLFLIIYLININFSKSLDKDFHLLKIEKKFRIINKTTLVLVLPILLHFFTKYLASINLDQSLGSSLLLRVGITGNDIYNGGLLGALQFLFGNRITICNVNNNLINLLSDYKNTEYIVLIYNCLLSLFGMFVLSILSIYGAIKLFNYKKSFQILLLPLAFILICYVCILQQSLSVHLMGYSFIFSVIFSLGLMYFFLKILVSKNLFFTKTIISIPCLLGIIILCLRVSMLTGPNG